MSGIVSLLNRKENLKSLGPVDDNAVLSAESKLGVKFTDEYRQYTKAFGAISLGDAELTGAVEPIDLNVVCVTQSARKITKNVPPEWYVISDLHIDGIIIWQDFNGKIYQTAPGSEHKLVADSLSSYIQSIL